MIVRKRWLKAVLPLTKVLGKTDFQICLTSGLMLDENTREKFLERRKGTRDTERAHFSFFNLGSWQER